MFYSATIFLLLLLLLLSLLLTLSTACTCICRSAIVDVLCFCSTDTPFVVRFGSPRRVRRSARRTTTPGESGGNKRCTHTVHCPTHASHPPFAQFWKTKHTPCDKMNVSHIYIYTYTRFPCGRYVHLLPGVSEEQCFMFVTAVSRLLLCFTISDPFGVMCSPACLGTLCVVTT